MKKYLRHIVLFFVILSICDLSFGFIMACVSSHAKGLGVAKRHYISSESNEDILMFGSSRMAHHYVPSIIEDSLGLSCYNCGEDGHGIIYSYGMLQLVLKRYTPKVIIYDVSDYDISIDDNTKYVALLKPYSNYNKIKDIIESVSPNDRFKLYSNMYKYNSICISYFGSLLSSPKFEKGYEPEYKSMNVEPEIDASVVQYSEFDQLKEKYIIAFINDCKDRNIRLIFSVSPWYKGDRFTHRQFLCIESLCCKYNIPFVYSFGQAEITENKKMFKDVAHLNDLGATAFTSSFVTKIKPLVSIQNRTLTE